MRNTHEAVKALMIELGMSKAEAEEELRASELEAEAELNELLSKY